MYSNSNKKLPHWNQKRNEIPAYVQTSHSRRYRVIFLIGICCIAWYHYSDPVASDIATQANINSELKTSHPRWKQEIITQPLDVVNVPDTIQQIEKALVERDEVQKPISASPVEEEQERIIDDHTSTKVSPEYGEDESSPKQKLSSTADGASHEFSEDNVSSRKSLKDSLRLEDSAQGHGVSEPLDQKPPPLVKEASDKVVEQHLSPAPKYDANSDSEPAPRPLGPPKFPPYSEYAALDEKGQALPDIVHIPFEVSTEDVELKGWEDEWFSEAEFNATTWGKIEEPKIDFVYTWVNGSDTAFQETIYPYEVNSTLNDEAGKWLESHRVNRYRDWDELRYSIRTVEKYASTFRNKIQLLVNAVADPNEALNATVLNPATIAGKQKPLWLNDDPHTNDVVQVLSQEDFFDEAEQGCLPTFNSLTIENQLFNTKSETDRLFALSDDMLLGKPHAASDIYSPLFGPTMGFKTNSYNTVNPPTDLDARRFGEKPFLIYTSWLLNRRFGERKRKGQIHFGHSLSRSVTREAIKSFPRPGLQSACQRFRGETGFQLYSWYVAFHYTIERQREALLWSYIMLRSDADRNGNLGWDERQVIMNDLEQGMAKESDTSFRKRMFYHMNEHLEDAGLEPPKVNIDVLWTSLDGPSAIKDIECFEFNVNECLAPGFSTPSSDSAHPNHVFSSAVIFDRVSRQHPKCGDCLIKLLLNRQEKGLGPLFPHADTQAEERKTVVKAMWKYQYTVVEPDAFFVMITDAEQVENVLLKRLLKKRGKVGQLCLNDDVSTEEEKAVADVRSVMVRLLEGMAPEQSAFEIPRAPLVAPDPTPKHTKKDSSKGIDSSS